VIRFETWLIVSGLKKRGMTMAELEELTLRAIDSMRHQISSETVVKAAAYAARISGSDKTVHQFVTALVMTDNLTNSLSWDRTLRHVMRLG
jgi:hypothetical protein